MTISELAMWARSEFLNYIGTNLVAQLEIDDDDGHLGRGDDKDQEDKEQEREQRIVLVLPNCLNKTPIYIISLTSLHDK